MTVAAVRGEVYRERVTEIRNESRSQLVLDSAAELLVRWGYRRVTIDDVTAHAGIGKGTVYLHLRTKDALFLTVLLRATTRSSGGWPSG